MQKKELPARPAPGKPHAMDIDKPAPSDMLISIEKQIELNTALCSAAHAANNAKVIRMIRLGAYIATKDSEGRTALHCAAMVASVKTCATLLREYAKFGGNAKTFLEEVPRRGDYKGMTALRIAEAKTSPYLPHAATAAFLRFMEFLASSEEKGALNFFLVNFAECISQ
jgi:ankyrin repeat protein